MKKRYHIDYNHRIVTDDLNFLNIDDFIAILYKIAIKENAQLSLRLLIPLYAAMFSITSLILIVINHFPKTLYKLSMNCNVITKLFNNIDSGSKILLFLLLL